MERKIVVFYLFPLAIGIVFGCGKPAIKDDDETVDKNVAMPVQQVYCSNIDDSKSYKNKLEAIEVNWMYMDDSLKNLCRPLNFKLPLMKSNILHLPDMAGIEISRLPMFKNFEIGISGSGQYNDTTFHYFINMNKGNCKCKISRYYYGDSTSKSFEGYTVLEQVTCNGVDKSNIVANYHTHGPPNKEKENDSTYNVTGHDH